MKGLRFMYFVSFNKPSMLILFLSVGASHDVLHAQKEADPPQKKLEVQPRSIGQKSDNTLKIAGKQSDEEIILVSMFADNRCSFQDLLVKAKELHKTSINSETKKTIQNYITTLERMAIKKNDRQEDTITKLIRQLKNQQAFEFFSSTDSDSPAFVLLKSGARAIPYLIDELENDDFTRSVAPEIVANGRVLHPMYVLRIGDCVAGILDKLTGKQFGDSAYIHSAKAKMTPKQVQIEAQKWWKDKTN